MEFARNEVGDNEGNIYPQFRYLIGESVKAIIERSVYKEGFNPDDAMQTLHDWKEYIINKKTAIVGKSSLLKVLYYVDI